MPAGALFRDKKTVASQGTGTIIYELWFFRVCNNFRATDQQKTQIEQNFFSPSFFQNELDESPLSRVLAQEYGVHMS